MTLSASGKLEIALIQLVPLAEAEVQPKSDEDLEEKDILSRNDVKQWYTETGIALLSVLIDELNVQGHKRLVIHENGDVLVTVEGKEQTVDTIPDFPLAPLGTIFVYSLAKTISLQKCVAKNLLCPGLN